MFIFSEVTEKIKEIKSLKKFNSSISTPEFANIGGITKENTNYQPSTPYAISRSTLDMHLMALKKITIFSCFY